MTKRTGRVFLVIATLGTLPLAAFADEIVHFTNGAEMTVKAHTVEKEKEMVKVDLGGNSFISFPLTMVDKIVSAGQDVFLNPGFHPSNQAIAAGTYVADTGTRGGGDPVPFHPRGVNGAPGTNLGEPAEKPPTAVGGQQIDMPVAQSRRIFNPAFPPPPGSAPQVIMPPGNKFKAPVQMQMNSVNPAKPPEPPPAPAPAEVQEAAPANDPAPEDPPDAP